MDEQQLSAIRLLIKELLQLPTGTVRPAGQSQPMGGENYIIVESTDSRNMGGGAKQQDGSTEHITQYSEHGLTLNFFGNNAAKMAAVLPTALRSTLATDRLDALGLGFLMAEPSKNLTALELDRVQRHQARYLFSAVENTADFSLREWETLPHFNFKILS